MIIIILTIFVSSGSYSRVFTKAYSNALILQAESTAHSLKVQLEKILNLGIELNNVVGFEKQCSNAVSNQHLITQAIVTDTKGNVIFHNLTEYDKITGVPELSKITKTDNHIISIVKDKNQDLYDISTDFEGPSGNIQGWIKVRFPVEIVVTETNKIWSQAIFVFIISVSVALVLLILALTYIVTGPITKLMNAISFMKKNGPSSENLINISSNDEIGRLSKAFNDLMTKVESSNEEIQLYAQVLENKVQERTSELEQMNGELIKLNDKLKEQSRLDPLTGLANRWEFEEKYNIEWRRANRNKTCLTIFMIDVDFFKLFNDTYGHREGDECLIKLANAIKKYSRRPADCAVRYGGEEFLLLLPDTDLKGAKIVAEKLLIDVLNLKIPHSKSSVSKFVTMSIGISCTMIEKPGNKEYLIDQADIALYVAKEDGRNRFVVYNSKMEK